MLSTCVLADGHRIFPNIPFLFEIQFAGDALGQRPHVGKTHKFKESSAKGERAAGRAGTSSQAPRLPSTTTDIFGNLIITIAENIH